MASLHDQLLPSRSRSAAAVASRALAAARDEDDGRAGEEVPDWTSSLPAAFLAPQLGGLAPSAFVKSHFDTGTYADERAQGRSFAKGTTCLAFMFQGGVLVAVDSRASQGPYVGSQSVRKIIEINRYLLGTMAGGAADCLFWQRNLGMQVRVWELRNKTRISVAAASKMLANTIAQYRGMGLSMGTMVCGYDAHGPALYYVDDDATRLKAKRTNPYFAVGSGSTYAYGVLDSEYRWDFSEQEAVALGKRLIAHAAHRDAYSGGLLRIAVCKPDGWDMVFEGEAQVEYQRLYLPEMLPRA